MRPGSGRPVGADLNLRLLFHLPRLIRLYYRLFRDPRVSWVAKAILLAGVLYVLLPVDLIVDLPFAIPGYLDDAVVLALAAKAFMRLCPRNVVREHVLLIEQGA
ncbi:MAG: DUF1232 domain-containing protein [Armatimonadetes bacterium]|nr:DUF1232 domain-containing protein [Armatimonadota bacterium]